MRPKCPNQEIPRECERQNLDRTLYMVKSNMGVDKLLNTFLNGMFLAYMQWNNPCELESTTINRSACLAVSCHYKCELN